jgi:hypothetical protein
MASNVEHSGLRQAAAEALRRVASRPERWRPHPGPLVRIAGHWWNLDDLLPRPPRVAITAQRRHDT